MTGVPATGSESLGGSTGEGDATSTVDATGTADATSTADASTGAYDSTGGTTGEPPYGFCECWDDLYGPSDMQTCTIVVDVPSCNTPLDCCPEVVPDGYSCPNDYPYIYDCIDRQCVSAGCEGDGDCQAYADGLGLQNMGCQESTWPCADVAGSCLVGSEPASCLVAADCCPEVLPDGLTCLDDYPFLFECNDGSCTYRECQGSDECEAYGAFIGAPDAQCTSVTSEIECYDLPDSPYDNTTYSFCDYSGKPPDNSCSIAADCCPETVPDPYVCLQDYPYLYDCTGGRCVSASCEADAQCETYAEQSGFEMACQ